MNVFKYHEKGKHRQDYCEVCRFTFDPKSLDPHHIYRKRNGDECIWTCRKCHQKIENPTAYGLPSSWAYDNGYLIRYRFNSMATKKKKSKTCKNHVGIYKAQYGGVVCQFCNKPVDHIGAKPKAKKAPIKKKGKAKKMGYEQQRPEIAQAERYKRRLQELNLSIKRAKNDNDRRKVLSQEKSQLMEKMTKLQDKIDNPEG